MPAFVGFKRENLEPPYPRSPASSYPSDAIVASARNGMPNRKAIGRQSPTRSAQAGLGSPTHST